jgi:hypothetical protein
MALRQLQRLHAIAIGDVHVCAGFDQRHQAGDMILPAIAKHDGFDQRRPVQVVHMIERCNGGNQCSGYLDVPRCAAAISTVPS